MARARPHAANKRFPNAAGIDIDNESHYVAVPLDREVSSTFLEMVVGAPPFQCFFPQLLAVIHLIHSHLIAALAFRIHRFSQFDAKFKTKLCIC